MKFWGSVQVALVPSVVLPVVDALSWDVAPGAHLEKHDRDLDNVDKFMQRRSWPSPAPGP